MNAILYRLSLPHLEPEERYGDKGEDVIKKEPMRSLLLILLVVGSIVAAVAGAESGAVTLKTTAGETVNLVTSAGAGIMNDSQLRLFCLSGALGGALISLGLFKIDSMQEGARKVGVSSISGVVFTPLIMHWWGISLQTDYVLGFAATVALCSWTVLQLVVPMVGGMVAKWFSTKTAT